MNAPVFTATVKLTAIEREINYRKRVYPRLIADGKMTDGFAASQLAIFDEIAAEYREAAGKERLL